MSLQNITRQLLKGNVLHAFRSGGGLRVIRIEESKRGGKLVGYGEYPHVQEALVLANKTLGLFGRIPKKSVYWTGSSIPQDELDAWLLNGRTFDAFTEDGEIVVQLHQEHYRDPCPQPILEEALKSLDGSALWHHRGGVIKIHNVTCLCRDSHNFGGDFDKTHWSFSLEYIKELEKPFHYAVTKTGRGKDFDEALTDALEQPALEFDQSKAA